MAQAVIFPKLGQTMEEGAIVKWLKQEGDKIVKGDILFEIETDKANLEVESFFEGVLLKIYVREGVTVPVNAIVGYIGTVGEKVPEKVSLPEKSTPPTPPAASTPTQQAPLTPTAPTPATPTPTTAAPTAQTPTGTPAALSAPSLASVTPLKSSAHTRLAFSPRARALVRETCIDPTRISGSGPNGRIVEKDVRAWLAAHNYQDLRITPAAKRLAAQAEIDILTVRGSGAGGRIMVEDVERAVRCKPVALSRMRQVIARRLVESKQLIPHFYVTLQVDITELTQLRSELKARGLSYTLNDFILEATVLSLEEFPVVNSTTDGTMIAWHGDVDLGLAVSVENGLVVPVIRAAQSLTLAELSAQAKELALKARSGKLLPDEMSGSSFTISNMGMLNVDNFSAIINPGEAGILAVSTGKQQATVIDGEIKIRTLMSMTLSVDHRIVDGAVAANFANAIRAKLENVELWKALVF